MKNLTDPSVHHELLIFEGLMALVNISSHDESLRDRMLNSGAWVNCRNLLTDKNRDIQIAAIELMANLALSEAVERFTTFNLEIDSLCSLYVLKQHP